MKNGILIILVVGGILLIFIFVKAYFFLRPVYKPQTVKVTIPKGWRSEEIAQLLEKSRVIKSRNFLKYLRRDYSQEFDFLKDKPISSHLCRGNIKLKQVIGKKANLL